MMNVKNLATAAAIVILPTVATAGDWDGAYIGVNLGYTNETAEVTSGSFSVDSSVDYLTYGVSAGYNVDLGNSLVAGGEVGLGSPFLSAVGKVGYDTGSMLVYGLAGFSNFSYDFGPTLGFGAALESANGVIFTGEIRFNGATDEQLGSEIDYSATSVLVGLQYQL